MRIFASVSFAAAVAMSAPAAYGQIINEPGDVDLEIDPTAPTDPVDTEGDGGDDGGDDGAQPAQPTIGPDGEAVEGEGGFYYYDEPRYGGQGDAFSEGDGGLAGSSSDVHVVRTGDTLWDISEMYFSDPWQWPRVWSFNPSITNPHWIYPGDLVRLREEGAIVAQAGPLPADGDGGAAMPTPADGAPVRGFGLRQLAFVEKEELEEAATIAGSEEERTMLSYNDVIYLAYPEDNPPQVGRRYAIYSPTETIKHPKGGKVIGSFVRVLGEVEVLSVKKGKRARAIVRAADDVIERGHRVGPLQRTYRDVTPTANPKNLQGSIVAQLGGDLLIGAREIVFTDLGAKHGIEPGNRLFIIRRGDAYPGDFGDQIGKNDERFPAYAIGEIIIVDVGESTSLGLVTLSLQESESGDLVLMRADR